MEMATNAENDGLWLLLGVLGVIAVIAVFARAIEQLLTNIGVPTPIAGPVGTLVFAGIILGGIWRLLR